MYKIIKQRLPQIHYQWRLLSSCRSLRSEVSLSEWSFESLIQVKLLEGRGFGSLLLQDFLSQAVEPPPIPSIKNAVQLLEEIGALVPKTEKLTLLGRHLATLPLPPRVSKMLLYGVLFGVLDPILTAACSIAYR